jgi:hypothetical protein
MDSRRSCEASVLVWPFTIAAGKSCGERGGSRCENKRGVVSEGQDGKGVRLDTETNTEI